VSRNTKGDSSVSVAFMSSETDNLSSSEGRERMSESSTGHLPSAPPDSENSRDSFVGAGWGGTPEELWALLPLTPTASEDLEPQPAERRLDLQRGRHQSGQLRGSTPAGSSNGIRRVSPIGRRREVSSTGAVAYVTRLLRIGGPLRDP
jgi:hypothetical protein